MLHEKGKTALPARGIPAALWTFNCEAPALFARTFDMKSLKDWGPVLSWSSDGVCCTMNGFNMNFAVVIFSMHNHQMLPAIQPGYGFLETYMDPVSQPG